MSSTRLPKKILKSIEGKTVLQHVIDRCSKSKYINKIIVATTTNPADDILENYCIGENINYFRGNENNVLERFYKLALSDKCDIIVRVTSDCPLIDVNIVDDMIEYFNKKDLPFLQPQYSNRGEHGHSGGFPDGTNPQIFTFEALENTYKNAYTTFDCEHVCPYMIRNLSSEEFKIPHIEHYKNINFPSLHLSLDTQQDYEFIRKIFELLYNDNPNFTIYDVLAAINDNKITN
tara:strand:+ start:3168 stop:3866 length:699 start_codon:yes stop_codon:yes gene_type:complete